MRVVLSTYDSRGGVEPFAALAVHLRELGCDVVMCVPPDCADRLAELDLPQVPLGPPVRELVHAAKPPSPEDVPKRAAQIMADLFDKVLSTAAGSDAVVCSGVVPAAAGGRSVAEKVGAFSALVHFCPIWMPSPNNRPPGLPGRPVPPEVTDPEELRRIDEDNYNALFRDLLNEHRGSVGLPPVESVRAHVFGTEAWLAADPILAPVQLPADVDVVQTGAWSLQDDRPLPPELRSFLDDGPPPVFAGFGSMRAPSEFARIAIEAVRAVGHRVVLARSWAGLEPIDDGDDCIAVGEVNQQALFRRCAAVIHHGGAGTTSTAAMAGAPQVVVPQMADQPYWAQRVADLGIGAAHDGPTPTVESLSAALATALAPDVRPRAADVAKQIRRDGAAKAARMLVERISR